MAKNPFDPAIVIREGEKEGCANLSIEMEPLNGLRF
jgi:hypothetical protein